MNEASSLPFQQNYLPILNRSIDYFPVCVCGRTPDVKLVNRKPVLPSQRELEENPRARSAKLRVAEKLKDPVSPR